MSQINVNSIRDKTGLGAPDFPAGLTVAGVITATTLNQNVTGNIVATGIITATTFSGSGSGITDVIAGGLSGTPDITVRNYNSSGIVTAASGNFTGNVSVGGTLTYEDVKNVDSVGLVTARLGVHATAGVSTFQSNTSGSYVAEFDNQHASGRGVKVKASSVAGAQNVVLLEDAAGNNLVEVKSTGKVVVNKHSVHMDAGANVVGVVTATALEGRHGRAPSSVKTAAYTLVAADAGTLITTDSNITVPSAIFTIGDMITFINNSSSNITLVQGSGAVVKKAGDGASGNHTIKAWGVSTVVCADTPNLFFVSGGM